jgi:hypothetical protein
MISKFQFEGKRPFGSTCTWEDNIKMVLKEIGFEDVDWIHLLRIRSGGGPCKHGNGTCFPYNAGNLLTS